MSKFGLYFFTGCASFKMADNFTLRVDIEYMQKQQTAMCKMWSSRPSNTVKTRQNTVVATKTCFVRMVSDHNFSIAALCYTLTF